MDIINPNVIEIDVLILDVNIDLLGSDMMVPFDNCLTGGTGGGGCGCNSYVNPCRVN